MDPPPLPTNGVAGLGPVPPLGTRRPAPARSLRDGASKPCVFGPTLAPPLRRPAIRCAVIASAVRPRLLQTAARVDHATGERGCRCTQSRDTLSAAGSESMSTYAWTKSLYASHAMQRAAVAAVRLNESIRMAWRNGRIEPR